MERVGFRGREARREEERKEKGEKGTGRRKTDGEGKRETGGGGVRRKGKRENGWVRGKGKERQQERVGGKDKGDKTEKLGSDKIYQYRMGKKSG